MMIKSWKSPNFGDSINKELVRLISGKIPKIIEAREQPNEINYLVVGSIMQFCDSNSVVWGSGFLKQNQDLIYHPREILAVRGPLTRSKVLEFNVYCPEVYGDPVLLFPQYYQPNMTKKYKLGIIPHWQDEFTSEVKNMVLPPHVIKIPHYLPDYEFINLVCSCEYIASSSLHGIIISDAYEIPNIQIFFLKPELFKFRDYYLSVKRYDIKIIKYNLEKLLKYDFSLYQKIDINLNLLMEKCPFKKKEEE